MPVTASSFLAAYGVHASVLAPLAPSTLGECAR
jgi:hypothetical protein